VFIYYSFINTAFQFQIHIIKFDNVSISIHSLLAPCAASFNRRLSDWPWGYQKRLSNTLAKKRNRNPKCQVNDKGPIRRRGRRKV